MLKKFPTALRLLSVTAIAIALQACGGGDDSSSISTSFVSWIDNSNDTYILDKTNQRFQVRSSDRKVFFSDKNYYLNGSSVNSSSDFILNGAVIGGVYKAKTTTGATVAVFRCNNGNAMSIIDAPQTYSIDCGTAASTPDAPPSLSVIPK